MRSILAHDAFVLLLVALSALPGCYRAVEADPQSVTPNAAAPPSGTLQHTGEDWPNFLGPRRDGTSLEAIIDLNWPAEGPPQMWRIEIGTGYSSPVVVGDDLVVMHRLGDEELVECFDANTGESKWRVGYPTQYECAYQYSNGPYSTPAIDGTRVFAWSAEGRLRCLELNTGDLIWQRDLNREFDAELGMFPVAGSVFVEDGRIYLNVGGRAPSSGVVALDAQTGETLWTATSDGPGDATAVTATIHGREYLFMFTAAGLVSLDPATGKVHWQIPFHARSGDTSNATTPVVWNDLVLISAYKVGSLCLRILPDGSYEQLWRQRRNLMCQYQNLIVRDGYVYGFSANDHTLRCLNMETGEVMWKWEPKHRRGQMLAVGNRLITIFETGHLAAIEVSPHDWNVRAMTSQPIARTPCFSAPALSRGRLFLRGDCDLSGLHLATP